MRVRERPRAKGIGEGGLLAVYAQGNECQNLMAERGFVEDRVKRSIAPNEHPVQLDKAGQRGKAKSEML